MFFAAFAEISVLDVWWGSQYASALVFMINLDGVF